MTSFEDLEFRSIYGKSIDEKTNEFARHAFNAGLDGVVSSVYESMAIKHDTWDEFKTICPGIRPFNEDSNDQARVANIQTARKEAADFIVVGRPIYQADNPAEVVEKILAEIK